MSNQYNDEIHDRITDTVLDIESDTQLIEALRIEDERAYEKLVAIAQQYLIDSRYEARLSREE